jgi:hypothetical protein
MTGSVEHCRTALHRTANFFTTLANIDVASKCSPQLSGLDLRNIDAFAVCDHQLRCLYRP